MMKLVEALKSKISDTGISSPLAWIKDWLFDNPRNEGRIIPGDAPVTLIVGIQMLFEFPYQAITDYLSDVMGEELAPFICVRDAKPTQILIVDMKTRKIVSFQEHEAWKFRFKTMAGLETWMHDMAGQIAKDMGRATEWQTSRQK